MNTKVALAQMTDRELVAYRRILAISDKCITSEATARMNRRHAEIVEQLLKERKGR